MASRREYADDEVEAAVQALSDPDRLTEAQRVVEANAPALQRILNQALDEANWFDTAHQQQVLLLRDVDGWSSDEVCALLRAH